jgi:hypothetical protein
MTFSEIISGLSIRNIINSKSVFLKSNEDNDLAKVGHVKRLAEVCKNLETNPADSRPYKVYTALLSQEETDAPVATVLENTLGEIIWTRDTDGEYSGTLNGAFLENKTFIIASINTGQGNTIIYSRDSNNLVYVSTSDAADTLIDNLLDQTPIEIRVYN